MKTRKPKVLFWSIYIDVILRGRKPPVALGGADVQLTFWARCFSDNGWETYSFYYRWAGLRKEHNGIHFLFVPLIRKVMFLLQYLKHLWVVVIRPDVVVVRTGGSGLFLLTILSGLVRYKLVYMVASDTEFLPCRPESLGKREKRILGLDLIVAQNPFQRECIEALRGTAREIPVIPNIWYPGLLGVHGDAGEKGYAVVWIGNIRQVKRPEWVTDLARDLPEADFAVIGSSLEAGLFKKWMRSAAATKNIVYLGPKSFQQVNGILARSKILVCTSVMEGFPNTFLQAWSHGIPVVSTVDPGGVLTDHHVGIFARSYEELLKGVTELISDQKKYAQMQERIGVYLKSGHDPQKHFEVLVKSLYPQIT